jgi:phosphoribosylamine--glycine ligase
MKVLIVGSGGREHALCWKLRQSPLLTDLYAAPGNPGIAEIADLVPVAAEEIHQLADFATEIGIDLTVVGPELPLRLGIVDEFERRGLRIFGPRQQAAEIEASKVFAKEFMVRHGIPTSPFVVAHDPDEARAGAARFGLPCVLKAEGLAAGKGVLIVRDDAELAEALGIFFDERRFGNAGDRVLIEPFLVGEEVSFIALSDGERVLPLATSKDYKRLGEGDTGPNTGGMGAHSPSGVLSSEMGSYVLERVIRPAVAGLAAENRPFRGFLYAGLMLTADGPLVLEFNARLGDPEAQPLLLRLDDDLLPILHAGAGGAFGVSRLHFKREVAACLVLAAGGYPDKVEKGQVIEGLDAARNLPGVEIFHAGTALQDETVVTAGGRVLNVCAVGPNLREALRRAYAAAGEIRWPGRQLRRDIGRRLVESQVQVDSRPPTTGYWEIPKDLQAPRGPGQS